MPESGWISRFFRYLSRFFANPPAPITAAPVGAAASKSAPATARPLKQPQPISTSATATVSTSSATAAPPSSSKVERKAEMHTTITRLAQELAKVNKHAPMIKFLGPRKQQPHFDRSSLPPVALSSSGGSGSSKAPSSLSASSSSQQKKPSSIGPVGSTPRGSGIDESQLPAFLKRRLPDADEINAINMGSAYRL